MLSRRFVQIGILLLFVSANYFGFTLLKGNYSTAHVLESFYLSDPFAALQMLFAGAVISLDIAVGAFIVLALYSVLFGRAFCSWVCPLNLVTDLSFWLRKKLGLSAQTYLKVPRNVRYFVLGLTIVLSAILGVTAFEEISPIGAFHRAIIFGSFTGLSYVLVVFLFDLLVMENGWCGHICPLGAFYSLTGKVRMLKVFHTEENCTACMKCKVVCPEPQVLHIIAEESGTIASGECTNCFRCIEVCEDDALKLSVMKK